MVIEFGQINIFLDKKQLHTCINGRKEGRIIHDRKNHNSTYQVHFLAHVAFDNFGDLAGRKEIGCVSAVSSVQICSFARVVSMVI